MLLESLSRSSILRVPQPDTKLTVDSNFVSNQLDPARISEALNEARPLDSVRDPDTTVQISFVLSLKLSASQPIFVVWSPWSWVASRNRPVAYVRTMSSTHAVVVGSADCDLPSDAAPSRPTVKPSFAF